MKDEDTVFRESAVRLGWVTDAQLEECIGIQDRTVGRRMKRLGAIAVEEGMLAPGELAMLFSGKRKPPPVRRIGGYEIKRLLGEGGLGTVFLAEQLSMNREVALKVLRSKWLDDTEFRQRFLLEAQHVGKMSHPNLIGVYDAGLDGDQLYFSMEFVPGKNVQELIDEGGQLALDQAIPIVVQIARAIDYYRGYDVVHRDIKPSNIFVTPQGVAKLGDFGFIKTAIDKEISMEGYILGTPDYISPEQAVGSDDLDYRSDVYSLGATLYHMLTGQTPFGGTESSVIRQHIRLELPSPSVYRPDLPEALVLMLERMMAKRREDRYANLDQLCDDFALVLKGQTGHVRPIEAGKSSILRDIDLTERRLERIEHEREELRRTVQVLTRERARLRAAFAGACAVAVAAAAFAVLVYLRA